MTDDFIGQTLGQYRIEAPLGSGGMGQVYRGVHRLLNRPAAIKVMQVHLAANPDFRARFLREAQSAAALKHFNIVEIYDFGEQDGHLYLVMELMTDGSLHTLLRRTTGQPLPLALGLDLVQQAAKGLAAAQALHMVHRDIKPDNLLLNRLSEAGQGGEQYVLKISDFGLARLAESGLTNTGVPMGTLAYMSPEQCQSKKLDGRSDLYSLGIVFYEVVTGYKPFQINDFSEALDKHVNVPPKPPREMRPYLPPGLEEIILRCLAKKPEERYATGTELVSALQRVLGNVGPQTTTQPHPSPEQLTPTGGTALQPPGAGGTPPPVVSTLATYTAVPRVRVLDQGGQTLQVVDVKSQGLTIGRQPGNDLVLSDQAISHRHLQVMWDGKQVTVKDLGSSNGTLLEGVLLLPQESQPWMERQLIRIGPFWLRLEGPSPVGTQTVQKAVPQTAAFGTTGAPGTQTPATMVRSGRIGMAVNPRMLTITPGQPANIQVILTNLGSIVDWFTTTVEGVAPEWVQGARQEVQLNPGMQETVELNVNVARSAHNFAQEYPVTIRARSREQPNESGTVQARWNVLPFTEDALRLDPRRAGGRGSASYAIALQNGGNTPAHYELSGEDDEQKIGYQFGSNPVDLAPGREARVPLAVRTRRHWIGREQRQPFQIHARPAGSSIPLTAPGEFVNKALLPTWILPVVGIVLAAVVGLGALLHVPPFPPGPPITTTTPTPTIATVNPVTPAPAPTITSQPTTDTQATAIAQANATATGAAQTTANATGTAQANATATVNASLREINNNDPGISYTGDCGYNHGLSSALYNDDVEICTHQNDSFTYTFTGTSIYLVTVYYQNHGGTISCYIDGSLTQSYNLDSSNGVDSSGLAYGIVLPIAPQLTFSQHTASCTMTSASGTYFFVDALIINR
jgi:serine/threonine protein kinase